MSKKRKSRRFESPEMVKAQERRDADCRSMNAGLAGVSDDLETDSHDPNDELPSRGLFGTTLLSPSWWRQVLNPSMQSSWILPSTTFGFDTTTAGIDATKLEALKTAEPYRVTQRIPDYVQVITAWRAWSVVNEGGYRLKALGAEHIWQPKAPVEAACIYSSASHPAPQSACTCGVWAFKELNSLVAAIGGTYGEIKVLGQVSLWGRVVETENGYRAEKAYPSELWLLDSSLEELGLIYDVPVRTIK